MTMGLYDAIGDAQLSQGNLYLLEGEYAVRVTKCFDKKTRKRKDLFIVEFDILASNNLSRPVGMKKVSWSVDLGNEWAMNEIAQFVLSALGVKTFEVDPATLPKLSPKEIEFIVSSANPLAGTVLPVLCVKKGEGAFVKHLWQPKIQLAA